MEEDEKTGTGSDLTPYELEGVTVKGKAKKKGLFASIGDFFSNLFSSKKTIQRDSSANGAIPIVIQRTKTPILPSILATIGELAEPIASVFIAKEQTKIAQTSIQALEQQLKIAQTENDRAKIQVSIEEIEMKEEFEQQETYRKMINGVMIISVVGLVGFFFYVMFGKGNKDALPRRA
ncbi:hypothetical protein [Emticicia sp. C21]|uniref:hypothetical protein n=1 Tax=Emticicia sp. C21 TaxID=2302915 RepID=UPI000E342EC6|nr:hypothetical protein [Emticicia sp. C21]RFS16080.1 hypothetical protein D0T08_14420 [Emticicia sp. C21]